MALQQGLTPLVPDTSTASGYLLSQSDKHPPTHTALVVPAITPAFLGFTNKAAVSEKQVSPGAASVPPSFSVCTSESHGSCPPAQVILPHLVQIFPQPSFKATFNRPLYPLQLGLSLTASPSRLLLPVGLFLPTHSPTSRLPRLTAKPADRLTLYHVALSPDWLHQAQVSPIPLRASLRTAALGHAYAQGPVPCYGPKGKNSYLERGWGNLEPIRISSVLEFQTLCSKVLFSGNWPDKAQTCPGMSETGHKVFKQRFLQQGT